MVPCAAAQPRESAGQGVAMRLAAAAASAAVLLAAPGAFAVSGGGGLGNDFDFTGDAAAPHFIAEMLCSRRAIPHAGSLSLWSQQSEACGSATLLAAADQTGKDFTGGQFYKVGVACLASLGCLPVYLDNLQFQHTPLLLLLQVNMRGTIWKSMPTLEPICAIYLPAGGDHHVANCGFTFLMAIHAHVQTPT